MSNRNHTFDKFRKNKKESKLKKIRIALKILEKSNFKNITRLSKAISKIVNEILLNENPDNAIEKLSYTTLLRNQDYRTLLEIKLSDSVSEVSKPSVSDYELLQIHCANLEQQIEVLKNKIVSFDSSSSITSPAEDIKSSSKVHDTKDIRILIHIIVQIMYEANDIFRIKSDGLYSPMGDLIIDVCDLNRFEELKKSVSYK